MSNGSKSAAVTAVGETPDIETASEDYARRFAGPVGEYFLDLQTRITLDLLSPWPGAKVLDVGGGHAQIAVPLVRHGYSVTVTGSDSSCRERLDRKLDRSHYKFCQCQPLSLPFAGDELLQDALQDPWQIGDHEPEQNPLEINCGVRESRQGTLEADVSQRVGHGAVTIPRFRVIDRDTLL